MINPLDARLWYHSIVLVTIVFAVHLSWKCCVANERAADESRSLRASQTLTCNALSYVYIVGVEGVGHHGVSPAIATIAKTCNMHVLYEMQKLRTGQHKKSTKDFQLQLAELGAAQFASNKVVIIEDASFPSGHTLRNATKDELKSSGYYSLDWIQNEVQTNFPNMKVKYLHLTRDFYRAVASHPEFDGGFQRHAQVLHSFMWHIHSEYSKINKKQPGIWRQISYEWFTNMDVYNCTAIVSAVIDFMQWDHCDVEYACKVLHEKIHKERKKPIVPADHAYAQTFNTKIPIPVLDIASNKTYRFSTVVSKRLPIEIVSDSVFKPAAAKVKEEAPFKRESVRSDFSPQDGRQHSMRDAQRAFHAVAARQKRVCAQDT